MSFWGGVSDAISSVADSIGNAISSIAEGIGNAISGIASGIGNVVGGGIADGISSFVESLASGISNVISGVGNWVSNNIIDPIGDTLSGLFQGSSQADTLSEEDQARAAILSQAAYAENARDMPKEITDNYHVEPIRGVSSNDTAWEFTDKSTGERYIGIGGTSPVSSETGAEDWARNVGEFGSGFGSQTARAIADHIQDTYETTGERTVVVGHSRGGGLSEEVARFAPEAIDYVVNVQGPSVIDIRGGPTNLNM